MPYDDENENENDGDLVKDLRKQLKEQSKAAEAQKEMLASLTKRDRERTLTDTLKANNVPAKIAKFYPSDQDATEENVSAWLLENADVFGFKVEAPDGEPTPVVPDGVQRLQNISQTSGSESGDAALLHSINSVASEADLIAMITAAGGGGVY